ncbi:MAG: methyl-accepting chemotaxis protein [Gammaproteobacteria bacterium]
MSTVSPRSVPKVGIALVALLLAGAALVWLMWPQAAPGTGQFGFGQLVVAVENARSIAATRLAGGDADADGLGALAEDLRAQWRELNASAVQRADLGALAGAGGDVSEIADSVDELAQLDEALLRVDAAADRAQRLLPQLQASARSVFDSASGAQASANEPFLVWLSQSVASAQRALEQRGPAVSSEEFVAGLDADLEAITNIVAGITGASDTYGIRSAAGQADPVDVETTQRLLDELQQAMGGITAEAEALAAADMAYGRLEAAGQTLAERLRNTRSITPVEASGLVKWVLVGILSAALVLLGVLLVGFMRARSAGASADLHAQQNERNQQAILRLLDELSNLADGDLTVRATVTEDITGAIADSINYAIEALRELVVTVTDSSILVDAAAKQSESTAHHMVRASETQVKQAAAASSSITEMMASVEEISGNAERCSDVARHSVEVAHKGAEAVRRTIEGMNTIRETIQDTSKRIKRLGESSQEIGNIVELIEEIADQTNILALNASIEASRAGEASRGFAVVADEVQKLAERSTAATRKIEVLVSTIQSDTNEAVVSMERSTTDVVGGALLAENAGAALEEIQQVSHQIAQLVQNISGSARGQLKVASGIARNMEVLREVSARTKQSTTATSSSISKLSELASQLRRTVSGFKLPGSGDHDETTLDVTVSPSATAGAAPARKDDFDGDLHSRREAVGDVR